MDSLAPEDVVPRLRGRFGRPCYVYVEETPSTQRLLTDEAPEGAVVVAEHQTAGRGRLGRTWDDAPGTSLLVSLALRPDVRTDRLPELTVVAAHACAAAIATVTALTADVKKPNDVLVGGRKIAGMLGEASERLVRLGIGVNVNQRGEELPPETRLPASSLVLELGRPVDRGELLVELLAELETRYDRWVTDA